MNIKKLCLSSYFTIFWQINVYVCVSYHEMYYIYLKMHQHAAGHYTDTLQNSKNANGSYLYYLQPLFKSANCLEIFEVKPGLQWVNVWEMIEHNLRQTECPSSCQVKSIEVPIGWEGKWNNLPKTTITSS